MTRTATPTIWTRLCHAWLQAGAEMPMDPRLAAEAGLPARHAPRFLSPLVGAYLR